MEYYRHHWYYIGGILFVGLSFSMCFFGSSFSEIQVILIYSFMAMLVHQVEEYLYPGGFPLIANKAMFKENNAPDRYPLNANQCMISNVFLTYPFYIIPIFFPEAIWLGLAVVGLGLFQVVAHCVLENLLLKRFYNPGCATALFLFLPIGAYYISYVTKHHLATKADFAVGSAVTLAAILVLFLLPILLLKNKNSRYPFSEFEMKALG
ncbi:MAG TPA: HXXEE domain-containing protein [Puia sp.]|jgi:hypothetical protein